MKTITEQEVFEELKKNTIREINRRTESQKHFQNEKLILDNKIMRNDLDIFLLGAQLRLIQMKLGQTVKYSLVGEITCPEEE